MTEPTHIWSSGSTALCGAAFVAAVPLARAWRYHTDGELEKHVECAVCCLALCQRANLLHTHAISQHDGWANCTECGAMWRDGVEEP